MYHLQFYKKMPYSEIKIEQNNTQGKSMKGLFFYLGLGLQLVGFTSVGLCLFAGMKAGDYGRVELAQFLLGMFLFYTGNYLRNRASLI
jgi:hypothetical protein